MVFGRAKSFKMMTKAAKIKIDSIRLFGSQFCGVCPKKMLLENLTNEDLDRAIAETTNYPAFLTLHFCLQNQRCGLFPEVKWRSFWMKNELGQRIDFSSRSYTFPGFRNFLLIASDLNVKFDKNELFGAFDKLNAEIKELFDVEGPVVVCFEPIASVFSEWHQNNFPDFYLKPHPCLFYYMTQKQQQKLLMDCGDDIKLPDGYYWDGADAEKDAQLLFETWIHSCPGDLEGMKAKIRNLPSAMIRVADSGKPAAFEVTDACGFLNHLYTMPEHRRKGLGTAVEMEICRKLIEAGMTPNKDVETWNSHVIATSEKSPYWTCWKDDSGNPVHVLFLKVYSKKQ
uniref:Glycine N-acyltransferase-like protein n=1 Tax=Panagrolaimus sp. JU765 TaxID=591449 RepID=A0AC34QUZ5_9BILA